MPTAPARIKDVFLAAAALTAAERSPFLDSACGGDRDLRAAVERLLVAHDRPDSLLDGPPGDPIETGFPGTDPEAEVPVALAPPGEPGSRGRLDHYEILGVVGRGGMGVVLKAHDTELRRIVALKLLAPGLCGNGPARKRFAREAQAAAAVRDEHVVGIHAVRHDAAVPYLVMEFVGGTNLEEVVRAGGPLDIKEVLRIGAQAARGLAAAHAQGLVHRDVKPANILLENGIQRVKITDFGLARAIDDASLTQSGVLAGTPLYMSPEQAGGERVDHRTDLFSLGSVLYTLCTGRPAFRADGTAAVIRRVCEDAPRPIREVNPDVPVWLTEVVARLMAKGPADRFQTAAEVAVLLDGYLAHLQQPDAVPLPAGWARPEASRPARPPASARRSQLVAAAMVVALAGALSLYLVTRPPGYLVTRPPGGPPDPPPGATGPPDDEFGPVRRAPVLASPLDARKRSDVPPGLLALVGNGNPAAVPAELIAALGAGPFALPGTGPIQYPAQTRDGRLLAVPRGHDVVVFNAQTGAIHTVLTGLPGRVGGVGFSPDGRRVAAGCWTDASPVLVWDIESGERVLTLTGHSGGVHEVVFSPKGERIASAGADRTVRVWTAATGQFDHQLEGATDAVCGLAYDPAGQWIAGHSSGAVTWVWEKGQRTGPRVLGGPSLHRTTVRTAVSADGRWLAAGSAAGAKVWSTSDWTERWSFPTPGDWVAFTPDSKTLLAAGHNCTGGPAVVSRWNVEDGKERPALTLSSHDNWMVYHLSPDGKTLFSAGADPPESAVRVYDAASGREQFVGPGPGGALCTTFSPDGRTLCVGGRDGSVRLWDLAGWKAGEPQPPVRLLAGKGDGDEVRFVAFSPDGRVLAAAAPGSGITRWDVATGQRSPDHIPAAPDCAFAFAPSGRTLAVPQQNGSVGWFDPVTGTERAMLPLHNGPVIAVAFSPDGQLMASSSVNSLVITNTRSRQPRAVSRPVCCTGLAFSPDGQTLVGTTGLSPGQLRLWDVATGEEVAFRAEYTDRGAGLALHPGGRTAVSVDLDRTLRAWDLTAGGARVWACSIRTEGIRQSLAYSPEGRHIAAVGPGGMISILRVAPPADRDPGPSPPLPEPGALAAQKAPADALNRADIAPDLLKPGAPPELVAVLGGSGGHVGQVLGVVASSDGQRLASTGQDGAVRLWELATGKLLHTATRPGQEAYAVTFGPGGRWIAGWRGDGQIGTCDRKAGTGWRPLATHGLYLTALAVSPDGATLASVGRGGLVRLWDLPTDPARRATLRREIPTDGACAWSVAFSPDGRTVAVGGEKGVARLFDVRSGWQVGTFRLGGWVRWIGFHPSGRSLALAGSATASDPITAAVWDLAEGVQPVRLTGYRDDIIGGAWRADGRLLITASADRGRIERWDAGTKSGGGPSIQVVRPADWSWLHGLALTPDGRHVATANPDGTIYVLRLAERGEPAP